MALPAWGGNLWAHGEPSTTSRVWLPADVDAYKSAARHPNNESLPAHQRPFPRLDAAPPAFHPEIDLPEEELDASVGPPWAHWETNCASRPHESKLFHVHSEGHKFHLCLSCVPNLGNILKAHPCHTDKVELAHSVFVADPIAEKLPLETNSDSFLANLPAEIKRHPRVYLWAESTFNNYLRVRDIYMAAYPNFNWFTIEPFWGQVENVATTTDCGRQPR